MISNNNGYQSSGYGGVGYGSTTTEYNGGGGGYQNEKNQRGISNKQYNRKEKKEEEKKKTKREGQSMQGIGNTGVRRRQTTAQQQQDNWFLTVISDMIQYLYTSFSAIGGNGTGNSFEDAEVKLTPKVQEALTAFKRFVRKPYDKNDTEHELILERLWEVCRPKKKRDGRKSEMWKDIGFQGVDPATDCRGTGVYGIQMIIYLAETYPTQFKRMMRKCDKEKNAYPFAIAALNVTMMLFEMLGFGMPNTRKHFSLAAKNNFIAMLFDSKDFYETYPFKTHKHYLDNPKHIKSSTKKRKKKKKKKEKVETGMLIDFGDEYLNVEPASPTLSSTKSIESIQSDLDELEDEEGPMQFNHVFEEVFCMSFFTMHRCWFEANASYFEFPKIMASTRQSIDYYLSHKIDDLSDIMKWNKKQRP
mmetsp:Transcript_11155/g.16472  ORF Transcript_11155/g.16472 Transcript_11155/m.16472 type:complete len:417 (+) Transcript_11155:57-1307(+)